MVSFVSYLLQFKDADNGMGDVARDIFADPGIKRVWGYRRLLQHMDEMRACDRVYKLLEVAKFAYDSIGSESD
jgi:hypothetical protein